MWFRLTRREWDAAGRDGRKRAFRMLVERGPPPGVLGYLGEAPVAWVALSPRGEQPVIERSRVTRPLDDRPAFAVTCFYLAPRHRRSGLMRPLIRAAVAEARRQGARLVEAYPADAPPERRATGFRGLLRPFLDAGFVEVGRRSPTRPILRLELAP
jgi:GNAT superfamily N-acetyltransferase